LQSLHATPSYPVLRGALEQGYGCGFIQGRRISNILF
jgi:hypothetical protein